MIEKKNLADFKRRIDIERLLLDLEECSEVGFVGMGMYKNTEVRVNKLLLVDAATVIIDLLHEIDELNAKLSTKIDRPACYCPLGTKEVEATAKCCDGVKNPSCMNCQSYKNHLALLEPNDKVIKEKNELTSDNEHGTKQGNYEVLNNKELADIAQLRGISLADISFPGTPKWRAVIIGNLYAADKHEKTKAIFEE